MRITLVQVLGWSLPLLGVLLGAYLSGQSDARRWKRDWLVHRIDAITTYHGDVCEALDAQYRITSQSMSVIRGQRALVQGERIQAAGDQWSRVLARRGVSAGGELQQALTAFDEVRAAAAAAVNARDEQAMAETQERLGAVRKEALRAIKGEQRDINDGLAPLLLPRRVVLWRRLRRIPLSPEPSVWPADDEHDDAPAIEKVTGAS